MFQYIQEQNIDANEDSDLGQVFLDMLVNLVLTQARECLLERAVIGQVIQKNGLISWLHIAMEAAQVSADYQSLLTYPLSSIPCSWSCLIHAKSEHYRALADYYLAYALTSQQEEMTETAAETIRFLHDIPLGEENRRPSVPTTMEERKYLGILKSMLMQFFSWLCS